MPFHSLGVAGTLLCLCVGDCYGFCSSHKGCCGGFRSVNVLAQRSGLRPVSLYPCRVAPHVCVTRTRPPLVRGRVSVLGGVWCWPHQRSCCAVEGFEPALLVD